MIYKLFILFVVCFTSYIIGKVQGYEQGCYDADIHAEWKEYIKEVEDGNNV